MRCVHVVFCKNCSIFYLYYQYCKSNLLANIVDIENLKIITKAKKKKLSESFLLTQWNAIRNDNTSSQKVLFFFYFFFRCHVTVKNKFVIILRKLKIYWAYLIIQMTNRLLDGKVTNILLFVLTLFLSSCYFLTNKN